MPVICVAHDIRLGGALRAIIASPYLGRDRELAERPIFRGTAVKN